MHIFQLLQNFWEHSWKPFCGGFHCPSFAFLMISVASEKRQHFNADSPFFGAFSSDRLPKATKKVTVYFFTHSSKSCKLYQRIPGKFRSSYLQINNFPWVVRLWGTTRSCSVTQGKTKRYSEICMCMFYVRTYLYMHALIYIYIYICLCVYV